VIGVRSLVHFLFESFLQMTEPHEEFGAPAPHTAAVFAQTRRERNAALRSSMIEAGVLRPALDDELTQVPQSDSPVLKIGDGKFLRWHGEHDLADAYERMEVAKQRATPRCEQGGF
jgi:hypothetical protein